MLTEAGTTVATKVCRRRAWCALRHSPQPRAIVHTNKRYDNALHVHCHCQTVLHTVLQTIVHTNKRFLSGFVHFGQPGYGNYAGPPHASI